MHRRWFEMGHPQHPPRRMSDARRIHAGKEFPAPFPSQKTNSMSLLDSSVFVYISTGKKFL
jgi:hypothetical protein